jgi:F-type H+-transporting ATPase subunit alpha
MARTTHIDKLVNEKIKEIKEEKNIFNTGKVIRVQDYIIEVSGLEDVAFFEKVTIWGKGIGYVNEIKENSVIVAVVRQYEPIEIGDEVRSSNESFKAIFAQEALGRITNLFGVDELTRTNF